jgi:hypothetical protein
MSTTNKNSNNQNISPLRRWIYLNKYFIKISENKDIKSTATHFLLDGGLWKIPMDKYQEFLLLLSRDLENGIKYYISENRTKIFRFICDLDFYEEFAITTIQVERIVKVIQEVINEYYSNKHVIICGTETKQVIINSNEYIKTGFHLVWPKIFLSVEKAKQLRTEIISKLIDVFGQRELHNSWENVVDLAIYTDNGLRMIGSGKMVPCKLCKIKDINCEKCFGTGRIDEGRIYKPVSVLGETTDDYIKKIKQDYYIMLLETCICNYSNIPETKLIKELIIKEAELPEKKRRNKQFIHKEENDKKIETFIRKKFETNYSEINIKKVTKVDIYTYFVEVDNNFCMNVNRTHNSSNIYFQIKPSGICQRCFCKKDTSEGRIHGVCKKFFSKEVPLTKSLSNLLFDNIELNKSGKTKKQIINFNLTNDNCLNNCKNILLKLENDLLS